MKIPIYNFAIGLVVVILHSLWGTYQFVRFNTADTTLFQEQTPQVADLVSHPATDRVRANTESGTTKDSDNVWPSWKNGTIQIQPILDFIHRLLLYPDETYTESRAGGVQFKMFTETPYVVSSSGVYSSNTLRKRNRRGQIQHRVLPIEGLMNEALQLLLSTREEERQAQWPQLDELLIQKGHSFPFLMFFGDHSSCDYHNYRDENNVSQSIPLFTFGITALNCWNGFPIASYKMVRDAKRTPADWDVEFEKRDKRFPWHRKVPKVVWRGSLSDVKAAVKGETPRSKMVAMANTGLNETSLFDVGFTNRNHFKILHNASLVPIKDPIRPFTKLQQYMAILDIDGNAWSSRFPTQLCLNSVTLKVEPRYVDYFMGTQVKPGIHYISIQEDFSDFAEKTRSVHSSITTSQQIVANARRWCRKHMIWRSLARDLLHSWEKYILWMNDAHYYYDVWEDQWKQWNRQDSEFLPLRISQKLSYAALAGNFPSS